MGYPDALKGRVGQAESGKKGIPPADGHTARDGQFLPTARGDVNRNGPFINFRDAPPIASRAARR
jgi:hypothetical protein